MTTTALTPSSYHQLITDLSTILQQGRKRAVTAVNDAILNTYWEMGKRIAASKEQVTGPDAEKFFKQLAADLKMEPSLIYRIHQFFRLYPDGVPPATEANQISWSHFVELLSIQNEKERAYYLKEALEEGWSRDTLRKAIQQDLFKIGKRKIKGKLERPKNPLHVYKAVVEKVVDGDTLLVRVDLGFDVWVNQRTRFRGVNASETVKPIPPDSSPSRAVRAKIFVEDRLKRLHFVVIKTYKSDMYGRYVVDLFYHPTLSLKEAVFDRGFFLNAQLLEAHLADFYDP